MYLLSINTVKHNICCAYYHFYYLLQNNCSYINYLQMYLFLSGISSCRLTLNIVVINSFLSVVNI
jgi:hypothetical protein